MLLVRLFREPALRPRNARKALSRFLLAIQIRRLNLARDPEAARLSSFRVYIRKVASGSMKVQSDFTRLCGLSGAHPVRREVLQGARRLLSAIEIPREQAR